MTDLVTIGGYVSSNRIVSIFMHRGFDYPMPDLDTCIRRALRRPDGFHVIAGTIDNPRYSWPVYAAVRRP